MKNKNVHRLHDNIYITSNEKPKEGDWYLDKYNNIYYLVTKVESNGDGKKIILATERDLIADGVQAIDDELLEWFIKNPSCEEVEVDYELGSCLNCEWNYDMCPYSEECLKSTYKIIIPKEEPKQYTSKELEGFEDFKSLIRQKQEEPKPHSFCETPDEKCTMNYCDENGCQNRKRELVEPQENPKQRLDCPYDFTSRCTMGNCDCKPKQDTVGKEFYESADKVITVKRQEDNKDKKYTEKDMIDFAFDTYCYISGIMKVPFNQVSENGTHAEENFKEYVKNKQD